MARVEGAGVELAYDESGSGPPLVLVHGMAADRAVWRPTVAALHDRARVIAYDRRGYGESGAPDPYERTTIAEQAEDLAALVAALGLEGAVACGWDLGALVVLDVLLRRPGTLRAAALVEPPVLMLVPEANEPLAAERLALETALRDGGPARAVELWLAARGVAGPDRIARARCDLRGFFADYGGLASLSLSRRGVRSLTAPLAVLDGPSTPAHVAAAADAVGRLVPGARRGRVDELAVVLGELL